MTDFLIGLGGALVAILVISQLSFALGLVLTLVPEEGFEGKRTSKWKIFLHCLFCLHHFNRTGTHTAVGPDDYTHGYDDYECKKCGVYYSKRR